MFWLALSAAEKVTGNLAELTGQVAPCDVSSVYGIRRAMGIALPPEPAGPFIDLTTGKYHSGHVERCEILFFTWMFMSSNNVPGCLCWITCICLLVGMSNPNFTLKIQFQQELGTSNIIQLDVFSAGDGWTNGDLVQLSGYSSRRRCIMKFQPPSRFNNLSFVRKVLFVWHLYAFRSINLFLYKPWLLWNTVDIGKHLLHSVTVQKSMSHLFTWRPIHYYYYCYYVTTITDKMMVSKR